jgi:aquaporin Z
MTLVNRLSAEFLGTMWLVLCGCGSAVVAATFPQVGIGLVGVSFAFGLAVLTAAYGLGHISGAHFNPAVTLGCLVAGRYSPFEFVTYTIAQVLGALFGATILWCIASGKADWSMASGLAANGYGEHSPGGYALHAAFVTEAVMTFMFVMVVLGSTDRRAPAGSAPLAMGLAFALVHLVSLPVTYTSVNPARSTGPALLQGGWAVQQLWLFWVAPFIGAGFAGWMYQYVSGANRP